MEQLSRGQRLPLASLSDNGKLVITLAASGVPLDFSCFGVGVDGKLVSEAYMTFFNQPSTPCGGVTMSAQGSGAVFTIDTARLPATIDQVVVTASVDGSGSLAQLGASALRLGDKASFDFSGSDFAQERAAMLGNLYRKDGQWRFTIVGQGFNGGLDALVAHFGGDVAAPAAAPAPAQPARISLDKRIEKEAPQLVNLVKAAGVSLAKAGLDTHRAKVALVLDISGSMTSLYSKGLVQQFADRILALGCKFDDDGEIDVFLFGANVHQPEPMSLANAPTYIKKVIAKHPLEGDTRYGRAMEAVRRYYFPDGNAAERKAPVGGKTPVYVMFVTDGSTSDQPLTEKQLRWSSREPIFWQFMGIGKGRKSKSKKLFAFADSDFPFLEKLDGLDGRLIDNADFFSVASPDEHSDSELYDLLMTEYPGWLKLAKQHGVLS
ncbi:VWA domain-containing protein [Massilia sp. PAMC28688]|nr:VWA domain-containing protein [Massilia sp. PAMC28688]